MWVSQFYLLCFCTTKDKPGTRMDVLWLNVTKNSFIIPSQGGTSIVVGAADRKMVPL